MARGRAVTTFTIAILAVACLHSAGEIKAHAEAASLNETARHDDGIGLEEKTPLTRASENGTDDPPIIHDHPHMMPGKPTKFDIDLQSAEEEKTNDQIETTRMANVTVNPLEINSTSTSNEPTFNATDCRGKHVVSCIRKDLLNFLDQLAKVDTYNVTESVQIVRNPEADEADACEERSKEDNSNANLLDKVHRYARTHAMKIQLNKDSSIARKARTFFGCESPDCLHGFLSRVY